MSNFLAGLPVVGGLFDDSEEKALAEYQKNRGLFEGLNLPQYQDYRPEDYQYAGDYSPEAAQAQTVSEDPMTRSAQLSALSKLSGLADTGLSQVDELGYAKAADMARREAQSSKAAALQNAQARGVAGGGLEFALGEMGGQAAANRAAQAARDQAAESARQRALYNQAYGSALSGMRDQDYRANRGNADILNQFNMANTQARNQAQQWNMGRRQDIANQNVAGHNQAQQYNNDIRERSYNDRLKQAQGIAGVNNQMGDFYGAQDAANKKKRAAAGQAIGAGIGYGLGGMAGGMAGSMAGAGIGGMF